MTGNRSTAVMQRRRVAPDSLDYFPTPPFATRALCEFLAGEGYDLPAQAVWEPACGEMHMVRPLAEYFGAVRFSDVHDYGGNERIDFLFNGFCEPQVDWVITNPPFRLAEAFIHTGRALSRVGTAMLLRGAFLEGQDRYARLFAPHPPSFVLQFAERVVMLEGRLIRSGAIDPFAKVEGTTASTATSYCWFVWLHDRRSVATELRWLAPCRERLEREGDYPVYAVPEGPCPLCDGHGTKDYAGFAMDPCECGGGL